MKFLNRSRLAVFAAVILAVSLGCVSKGKYKDLEAERNAVMTQRDEAQAERELLTAEREVLSAELESSRAENQAMLDTYGELVRELQTEVEAGQITIQEVVDGIRLGVSDELLFSSGAANLGAEGTALIARVAQQISDGESIVSVEGHTDNVAMGPKLRARYPTNWELAGARAALVTRVLSENGVAPERLRAVSRGPFAPLAPNDSEENRARNRRTEIILRALPAG